MNKKIYIAIVNYYLIDTQENECDIIGVFENKEKALKELQKIKSQNINEFDFVEDEQCENRLFYKYQENWNNYIELDVKQELIK